MTGVKLYPNHFRSVHTMHPLDTRQRDPKGRLVYTQLPKGTVVRVATVERWAREKEVGRLARCSERPRIPRIERNLRARRALRIRVQ